MLVMQACGVMQVVQYQVSTPRSAIAADVAQHYVPPPPYFGKIIFTLSYKLILLFIDSRFVLKMI